MAKKSHGGAVLAGIVGLTTAAVGTYFLYGSKNASKNRKKAKAWMLKAKAEILENLEKTENITEDIYHKTVDSVMDKYAKLKSIDKEDIEEFAKGVKKHWKEMAPKTKKSTSKKKK